MHIVYFCTTPTAELLVQLETSILLCKKAAPSGQIHLYTDDSRTGQHWPIIQHILTPNQLKQWKGQKNFFWRIKMHVIADLCALYPNDPILYLDADTLALDLPGLQTQLSTPMMHLNEGALGSLNTKTERRMLRELDQKTYQSITTTPESEMFNAGVIALPPNHGEAIHRAIGLCDSYLETSAPPRLLEQLAFSLALNKDQRLQEAQPFVAHYWSTKDWWVPYLTLWLDQQGTTFKERLQAIHTLNLKAYPYWAKRSNTVRRLRQFLGK
jgi:hypothetical protein